MRFPHPETSVPIQYICKYWKEGIPRSKVEVEYVLWGKELYVYVYLTLNIFQSRWLQVSSLSTNVNRTPYNEDNNDKKKEYSGRF